MSNIPDIEAITDVYFYAEHKCGIVKQQIQVIVTPQSIKLKCMKCQAEMFYRRIRLPNAT